MRFYEAAREAVKEDTGMKKELTAGGKSQLVLKYLVSYRFCERFQLSNKIIGKQPGIKVYGTQKHLHKRAKKA